MPTWLSKFKTPKEFEDNEGKSFLRLDPAGWRRIKRLYHGLLHGSKSFEPELVDTIVVQSFLSGFMFGSLINSRAIIKGRKSLLS